MSFGIVVSIAAFDATGQSVTKYASAAQRSTIDTCRTLFVWIAQLITRNEKFNVPQLFAFFLLVGGTLIYNEIVIVPIGFMKYNTKDERAKREVGKLDGQEIVGLQDPSSYVHSSPGALYDQGRNIREIEKKLHQRDSLVAKHQNNMMDDDNEEFIAQEGKNTKY